MREHPTQAENGAGASSWPGAEQTDSGHDAAGTIVKSPTSTPPADSLWPSRNKVRLWWGLKLTALSIAWVRLLGVCKTFTRRFDSDPRLQPLFFQSLIFRLVRLGASDATSVPSGPTAVGQKVGPCGCASHPSHHLYLYINGRCVESVARSWWEIPAIARRVRKP